MSFDPVKESIHVICRSKPDGGDFKTLGVKIDGGLTMERAVKTMVAEANWKLRTLERSARFQDDGKQVLLYKARILSYWNTERLLYTMPQTRHYDH